MLWNVILQRGGGKNVNTFINLLYLWNVSAIRLLFSKNLTRHYLSWNIWVFCCSFRPFDIVYFNREIGKIKIKTQNIAKYKLSRNKGFIYIAVQNPQQLKNIKEDLEHWGTVHLKKSLNFSILVSLRKPCLTYIKHFWKKRSFSQNLEYLVILNNKTCWYDLL